MDAKHNIYELTEEQQEALLNSEPAEASEEYKAKLAAVKEDMARLDGYLKGRADSDKPKRGPGANADLAG